jgi:hypothetical protein
MRIFPQNKIGVLVPFRGMPSAQIYPQATLSTGLKKPSGDCLNQVQADRAVCNLAGSTPN